MRALGAVLGLVGLGACSWESIEEVTGSALEALVAKEGFTVGVWGDADCSDCDAVGEELSRAAALMRGNVRVVRCADRAATKRYGYRGQAQVAALFGARAGDAPRHVLMDMDKASAEEVVSFAARQLGFYMMNRRPRSGPEGQARQSKGAKESGEKKQKQGPDVTVLTEKNWETEFVADSAPAWIVMIFAPWCGHCKVLKPAWEQAARELRGLVRVGSVNGDEERGLAGRLGVRGFPTIRLWPSGERSGTGKEYAGARTAAAIVQFALPHATAPATVSQLTSQDELDDACRERTCLIAFLPHIYDTTAKERTATVERLAQTAGRLAGTGTSVVWAQGADFLTLEDQLHLHAGYPTLVAVNTRKKVYAVHRGNFGQPSLDSFAAAIQAGKTQFSTLPRLAPIYPVDEWDGKDHKPPEEEL